MRFRIPEILFGALLTVAVFAMGFVIALSMPPPEQKIESSNKQKPIEESHERTAEQQIAYYTKWLAWFTGALVAVAGIQGYFLLRADKTARITADAAKQSADGLRDAERPHMVLSELKITGIRRPPDSQGRVRLSVSTRILNYGRSPAHIKSFINLVVVGTEIGSPPQYGELIPKRYLIAPNYWYGTVKPEEVFIPAENAAKIISGEEAIWDYFRIEYEDTFRRPHITRAAYRIVIGDGDSSEHFYPDGPDAYWEYT